MDIVCDEFCLGLCACNALWCFLKQQCFDGTRLKLHRGVWDTTGQKPMAPKTGRPPPGSSPRRRPDAPANSMTCTTCRPLAEQAGAQCLECFAEP
eukprot:364072-Chlamydomonas_euryale.AAC.20